jgi:hypothetical protein
MKHLLISTLLTMLLASCSPAGDLTTLDVAQTPVSMTSATTPTAELAAPPTSIVAPTIAPIPTATPRTGLTPEQWQEWPVVPNVTGRAIEIYKTGLTLGNNPHAFSKVGDCQNIKQAFMGFFDLPDRYNLGTDYQYLQGTIDNFAGYFNTDGQAVKGGFNAATVLSPLWANPEVCQPGENPLECELRLTKPSIVFISFEVWWEGRTPETYEKYMRQVIETVIARGAVPILVTKADNVEGDHSINLTTARLAFEYDLPLWNFWRSVQSLPNHGMDPVRNDGFHISTDGWNQRSFTGLQALDSIWHGVREADSQSTLNSTTTPMPTQNSSLLPIPAGGPMLGSAKDRIVFGLVTRQAGEYKSQGVFLFDLSSRTMAQLLGPGSNFQSASPDAKYLLVNQGSSLFTTDGLTLTLLSSHFFPYGSLGAVWLPDGRIALINQDQDTNSLVLINAAGSGSETIALPASPIEIFPSTDGTHLTWESGTCSSSTQCTRDSAWLTDLASGQTESLIGQFRPLVSPGGQVMAYAYAPSENKSNLAFQYFDGSPARQYPLMGDLLAAMAWQPGGGWLAVSMDVRSDYSGRVTSSNNYLVNSQDYSLTRQLPSVTLLNPNIVWSPDGLNLILLGTDWQESSYSIRLWNVNAATGQGVDLSASIGLSGSDYLFIRNAVWLK